MLKRIVLVLMCVLMIALSVAPALAADIRSSLNDVEKYDTIYLGYYHREQKCIEWLVLDNENTNTNKTGMFLVTKDKLYSTGLDHYTYERSGLREKCNTAFGDIFQPAEKSIILQTSIPESDRYVAEKRRFEEVVDHSVKGEYLFLMSASEYQKYLKDSPYAGKVGDKTWYTRSENNEENNTGNLLLVEDMFHFVYTSAGLENYRDLQRPLRPAMNIDALANSIVFVSPAAGGKEEGIGLNPISETENVNAWKLTLLDNSRFFEAETNGVVSDDRMLEISYTGAGGRERIHQRHH